MSHGLFPGFSSISRILWCEVLALGTVRLMIYLWLTTSNVTILLGALHSWIFIGENTSKDGFPYWLSSGFSPRQIRPVAYSKLSTGFCSWQPSSLRDCVMVDGWWSKSFSQNVHHLTAPMIMRSPVCSLSGFSIPYRKFRRKFLPS